jgi:eukaryotic-like serine/threonine-protein kinase
MAEQRIGDYEIMSSLGRGGFGSVYKAKASNGSMVALKVLNPQVLDNQKVVKKFFHEAMILAKLDHPNICRLIEFFPDGQNYAIVMEYVEGTELKELLQQQSNGLLPFDRAFRIAKQSLSAFQYAHENGILHRDIKPANIMISKEGNIKIMDFGIAKVAGAATHDTAASMLSIHYTPPERFDPSRVVDTRSDIYSLGLVFYELFAGRRPFDVDETSQIMFWHLNEIPEPPETFVSGLPQDVSLAIQKALEKDPDDRFQDFKEFDDALGAGTPGVDYASSLDDTAASDQTIVTSLVEPTAKKKKAKKKKAGLPATLIAGISAAVIILLMGGFFAYQMFLKGPAIPGSTQKETVKIEYKGGVPNSKGYPEVINEKDNSPMIYIPAGEFTMGSDKYTSEGPIQQISIDAYLIDKYLVTNRQFKQFVEETNYQTDAEKNHSGEVWTGRRWSNDENATWRLPDGATPVEGREDHPVSQVSYNDAETYCKWAGKDLPAEAQWEKAARGPGGNTYPWGNFDPDDSMANYSDSFIEGTTPTTKYEKGQSYYGAFDMAGNLYQWCKDWYVTGIERKANNPTGPGEGTERVLKGGSYSESMDSLRSPNRISADPATSKAIYGFRCVKKAE